MVEERSVDISSDSLSPVFKKPSRFTITVQNESVGSSSSQGSTRRTRRSVQNQTSSANLSIIDDSVNLRQQSQKSTGSAEITISADSTVFSNVVHRPKTKKNWFVNHHDDTLCADLSRACGSTNESMVLMKGRHHHVLKEKNQCEVDFSVTESPDSIIEERKVGYLRKCKQTENLRDIEFSGAFDSFNDSMLPKRPRRDRFDKARDDIDYTFTNAFGSNDVTLVSETPSSQSNESEISASRCSVSTQAESSIVQSSTVSEQEINLSSVSLSDVDKSRHTVSDGLFSSLQVEVDESRLSGENSSDVAPVNSETYIIEELGASEKEFELTVGQNESRSLLEVESKSATMSNILISFMQVNVDESSLIVENSSDAAQQIENMDIVEYQEETADIPAPVTSVADRPEVQEVRKSLKPQTPINPRFSSSSNRSEKRDLSLVNGSEKCKESRTSSAESQKSPMVEEKEPELSQRLARSLNKSTDISLFNNSVVLPPPLECADSTQKSSTSAAEESQVEFQVTVDDSGLFVENSSVGAQQIENVEGEHHDETADISAPVTSLEDRPEVQEVRKSLESQTPINSLKMSEKRDLSLVNGSERCKELGTSSAELQESPLVEEKESELSSGSLARSRTKSADISLFDYDVVLPPPLKCVDGTQKSFTSVVEESQVEAHVIVEESGLFVENSSVDAQQIENMEGEHRDEIADIPAPVSSLADRSEVQEVRKSLEPQTSIISRISGSPKSSEKSDVSLVNASGKCKESRSCSAESQKSPLVEEKELELSSPRLARSVNKSTDISLYDNDVVPPPPLECVDGTQKSSTSAAKVSQVEAEINVDESGQCVENSAAEAQQIENMDIGEHRDKTADISAHVTSLADRPEVQGVRKPLEPETPIISRISGSPKKNEKSDLRLVNESGRCKESRTSSVESQKSPPVEEKEPELSSRELARSVNKSTDISLVDNDVVRPPSLELCADGTQKSSTSAAEESQVEAQVNVNESRLFVEKSSVGAQQIKNMDLGEHHDEAADIPASATSIADIPEVQEVGKSLVPQTPIISRSPKRSEKSDVSLVNGLGKCKESRVSSAESQKSPLVEEKAPELSSQRLARSVNQSTDISLVDNDLVLPPPLECADGTQNSSTSAAEESQIEAQVNVDGSRLFVEKSSGTAPQLENMDIGEHHDGTADISAHVTSLADRPEVQEVRKSLKPQTPTISRISGSPKKSEKTDLSLVNGSGRCKESRVCSSESQKSPLVEEKAPELSSRRLAQSVNKSIDTSLFDNSIVLQPPLEFADSTQKSSTSAAEELQAEFRVFRRSRKSIRSNSSAKSQKSSSVEEKESKLSSRRLTRSVNKSTDISLFDNCVDLPPPLEFAVSTQKSSTSAAEESQVGSRVSRRSSRKSVRSIRSAKSQKSSSIEEKEPELSSRRLTRSVNKSTDISLLDDCMALRPPLEFAVSTQKSSTSAAEESQVGSRVSRRSCKSIGSDENSLIRKLFKKEMSTVVASIQPKKAKRRKRSGELLDYEDCEKNTSIDSLPKKPHFPKLDDYMGERFYKYLIQKMEPKYGIKTNREVVKVAEKINEIVREVKFMETDYFDKVREVKILLAKKEVIKVHYDFWVYCHQYLPWHFNIKSIPSLQPCGRPLKAEFDPDTAFDSILPSQSD